MERALEEAYAKVLARYARVDVAGRIVTPDAMMLLFTGMDTDAAVLREICLEIGVLEANAQQLPRLAERVAAIYQAGFLLGWELARCQFEKAAKS